MVTEQFERAYRLRHELKASAEGRDPRQTRSLSRRVSRLYRTSDDWMARYEVVLGVIDGRFTPSLPLLRRALFEDPNELIRHDAVYGLGEMGTDKDQKFIIRALQDQAPIVRHEAASVLGFTGDESAMEKLKPLLHDQIDFVADTARIARDLIMSRQRFS